MSGWLALSSWPGIYKPEQQLVQCICFSQLDVEEPSRTLTLYHQVPFAYLGPQGILFSPWSPRYTLDHYVPFAYIGSLGKLSLPWTTRKPYTYPGQLFTLFITWTICLPWTTKYISPSFYLGPLGTICLYWTTRHHFPTLDHYTFQLLL